VTYLVDLRQLSAICYTPIKLEIKKKNKKIL